MLPTTQVELTMSRGAPRANAQQPLAPAQLVNALDRVGDGVLAVDAQWRITFVSDHACRILQRQAEDLVGSVVWNAVPAVIGGSERRHLERAMSERVPVEFDANCAAVDCWFEHRAVPTSDGGVIVLLRDVSATKRLEGAIRRRAAELLTLFDGNPDCLITLDRGGRIAAINARGAAAMGIKDTSALIGTPWEEFWTGTYRNAALRAVIASAAGETSTFQGWRATGEGDPKWWDVRVALLPCPPTAASKAESFLCVLRDATVARREEQLRAGTAARDRHIAAASQACLVPSRLEACVPGFALYERAAVQ